MAPGIRLEKHKGASIVDAPLCFCIIAPVQVAERVSPVVVLPVRE